MQQPLDSYLSWIRRAESFVRSFNDLPGRWSISVAIDPPISDSQADELASLLPFGLPHSLRRLYTEGAGSCRCRYNWSPDEQTLRMVHEVIPHQRSFYGGPEFIPWTYVPASHQNLLPGLDSVLQEEQPDQREIEILNHCIPFIAIGNGDTLALRITDNPNSIPVVYFSHETPERPIFYISPSLDQFLVDWEAIGYIGPEIWLLGTFLDGDRLRGPLDVQQDTVVKWRDVLRDVRIAKF